MDQSSNDLSALADDFRDCIERLNAHGVAFILVGGYAVGWHGVVRATGDIDFLYERSPQNVQRLCLALEEFGAPVHLIDRDFLLSRNAVTQIGREPRRIDFLASLSGVSYARVRAGAETADIGGQQLLVIGLAELRANKRATGRERDKLDLRLLPRRSSASRKRR